LIWKKLKSKKWPSDGAPSGEVAGASQENARTIDRFRKRVEIAGVVTILIALTMIAVMAARRSSTIRGQAHALQKEQSSGPIVEVTRVRKAPPFRDIEIIGEARPFLAVVIYARAAGYLTQINVDKGDLVREGQILATIESPETDKAYLSALADWYNKKRIADRSKILLKRKLISQQEADISFANADMAAAALDTQRVLKSYEQVKAPFLGTIANRYVDPGALLQNATQNPASTSALFELSQNDKLRIYVYPDQPDASFIKPGTPVEITLTERPELKIQAAVTRSSEQLDTKTRKLLTEIDIENPGERIVPGSFVQVHMRLNEGQRLEIPAQALTLRDGKTMVPVVEKDDTIHYRSVTLGENDGKNIRVLSGLQEGETIALSIGTSLADGQKIQPRSLAPEQTQLAESGPNRRSAPPMAGVANPVLSEESSGEAGLQIAPPYSNALKPAVPLYANPQLSQIYGPFPEQKSPAVQASAGASSSRETGR
jgi:RND family efflux transporter MFP subunit